MKLYHGSDHIIKKPIVGFHSITTDYGDGFYLTSNIELAKEWASSSPLQIGYVNVYNINFNKLKVLDLTNGQYSPLNWLALLVFNRSISSSSKMMNDAKEFLLSNYLIDVSDYDIIIGYRADDSYFAFVKAFLRNELSVFNLEKTIKLGELGTQYFVRSKKAFEEICFVESICIDTNAYYERRRTREKKAIKTYRTIINKSNYDDTFIMDLMRDNKNENI